MVYYVIDRSKEINAVPEEAICMRSIGEISRIVNVSKDTLRYYDEISLLKPEVINPSNGYRYYTDNQIHRLFTILEYKSYGFSLLEISELLNYGEDEKLQIFEKKHEELLLKITEYENILGRLENKIGGFSVNNYKVMIVDDAPFMRKVIGDFFAEQNYEFFSAENGEEAIKIFKEQKPDIILMDIVMPDKNGIDCTREILTLNAEAIIIMLSANITPENFYGSIEAGAVDIIAKPFQLDTIIDKTNKLISNNGRRTEYDLFDLKSKLSNFEPAKCLEQKEIDELLIICRKRNIAKD